MSRTHKIQVLNAIHSGRGDEVANDPELKGYVERFGVNKNPSQNLNVAKPNLYMKDSVELNDRSRQGSKNRKVSSWDQHGAGQRFGNKRKGIAQAKVLDRRATRHAVKIDLDYGDE